MNTVLISIYSLDFGVRHISSFLQQHGLETFLLFFRRLEIPEQLNLNDYLSYQPLDFQYGLERDIELTLEFIQKTKPGIVGVSVGSPGFQSAVLLSEAIKKNFPEVVLVWGGAHAIIAPEECIKYADLVCLGEGEYPMLELARCVRDGKPLTGIESMWIKQGETLEKNGLRELISDLDVLPFPDFARNDNKFLVHFGRMIERPNIHSAYACRTYPIMTSRGCPFSSCDFCCNSVFKKRYEGKGTYLRRRSVDNVIQELRQAARECNVHTVRFWDDIFTFDEDWISEFCGRYQSEIGKPFICYAHPRYTKRKVLEKLAGCGLEEVNIGVQSGSERVSQEIMNRRQSNRDIVQFARFMKRKRILVCYDIITDNPYEEEDDHRKVIELLMQLPRPFRVNFFSLCWFPQTELTKRAIRDGFISPAEQEQYTAKAVNNFFMHPAYSRSRKDLFWNCIRGITVLRLRIPKGVIKWLMGSVFFRRRPDLLHSAVGTIVRLLETYKWQWRGRPVIRKMCCYFMRDQVVCVPIDYYGFVVIARGLWEFWVHQKVECNLFPLENGTGGLGFQVRVIKDWEQEDVDFLVSLSACDSFDSDGKGFSVWKICLPLKSPRTDWCFEVRYPELRCSRGNETYFGRLIHKGEQPCEGKMHFVGFQLSSGNFRFLMGQQLLPYRMEAKS